jgi:hypothetical protein
MTASGRSGEARREAAAEVSQTSAERHSPMRERHARPSPAPRVTVVGRGGEVVVGVLTRESATPRDDCRDARRIRRVLTS